MGILEFLGLGEAEQWEEFTENGEFLAKYDDIDSVHYLFWMQGFYVELSSAPRDEPHQCMNPFLGGPRLDKYMAGDLDYIFTDLEIDLP